MFRFKDEGGLDNFQPPLPFALRVLLSVRRSNLGQQTRIESRRRTPAVCGRFILVLVQVNVLYFGIIKDLFGCESEVLDLAEGSMVSDAIRLLRDRASNQKNDMWSSLAVAVNREYASFSTVLGDQDELALLPPVSGGSPKVRR